MVVGAVMPPPAMTVRFPPLDFLDEAVLGIVSNVDVAGVVYRHAETDPG